MSTATPPKLLSADEYLVMDEPGCPTELVRGEIVEMNQPTFRHGRVCARIGRLLDEFAETNDVGHVVNNDSGVITERGPDTVRGPDVAYFSYDRIPKDEDPDSFPYVSPEIVFEVLSPSNRWTQVLAKIGEYLDAGVCAVVVVDPGETRMQIYSADGDVQILQKSDLLTFPEILPGFSNSVEKLIRR